MNQRWQYEVQDSFEARRDSATGNVKVPGWIILLATLLVSLPVAGQAQDSAAALEGEAAAGAAVADAGDEAGARPDASLEEVKVTGTASNYESSVLGKRAADGVVDMFDTDELGRLPDNNIGETLNRIPGVTMLLEKGEGRFVQIRGVSPRLNNVTVNGMALGSVDTDEGGRAAPLDTIGTGLLDGVQVVKTPTPDMDGTGIGGTLNIDTKQPFDFEQDFTKLFSARVGDESISSVPVADVTDKETPWSADFTLAGKNRDHTVGWLFGASQSNRRIPLLGVFQDEWFEIQADSGETLAYPTATKNNVTIVSRERTNLNGALQFRPTDNSSYFIRSFYAKWDELQFRNRYNHGLSDRLTSVDGPNAGTISGNRVQVDLRSEPTEKELFSVAAGGENIVRDWTIDYIGQINSNTVEEPNTRWEFRSGSKTFGPDEFFIDDDNLANVNSTGLNPQDPSLQDFRRVGFAEKTSEEDIYIGAINLTRDLQLGFGSIQSAQLKFGAKYTKTDRDRDDSLQRYVGGDEPWSAAEDPSLNGGAFTNPVPIQGRPNLWLSLDGLTRFFETNRDNPRYFAFDEDTTFQQQFQNDFKITEEVAAAYLMGKFQFKRINLIAGVRYESTDVDSSAFTIISDANGLSAEPVDGGGSYSNFLPALITSYDVTDDVVVRAAYTKALGRPEFDAIAPRSSLDVEDQPALGLVGDLTIGNPDLEARESDNFDLSIEWYFDEGSLLSLSLFYKDIKNEIIGAPTQRFEDFTFLGTTYDIFDINTTTNAQSAWIKGMELTFVDVFEFLPSPMDGLGFAAALTLLDSEIDIERNGEVETLPLLEQADSSLSLTLFYQKGPWDLSVTYNENDNFLTDLGPTRELDLDQGSFGRYDARVQYSLNDNLKFFVEGVNLNDEPTTEFQGGIERYNTEYEYAGRTISIGISASY